MKHFLLSLALAFSLLAGMGNTAVSATQTTTSAHPADVLVRQTIDEIMNNVKQQNEAIKQDGKVLHELVNKIVLPHFDFNKMARWVLGKYWRKANDNQKAEFTEQFRILLVRTYSNALADNTDKIITYLPIRIKNEKDVTVQTEIEQQGSFPLPINYKLYLKDKSWKVYDINIDGISLVTNYRTSFSTEIRKSSIDGLITTLTRRNKEVEG